MTTMTHTADSINLTASNSTGQRRFQIRRFRPDRTIGDLIAYLLPKMRPRGDRTEAAAFHAYLDRESRHLRSAERVGEVLREGDQIRIDADVQAGRR